MGYEARKTEHSGPKRGNGAYWGYRWDAKKESNRVRCENWKREIRAALAGRDCERRSRRATPFSYPFMSRSNRSVDHILGFAAQSNRLVMSTLNFCWTSWLRASKYLTSAISS